ncbi:hypothetical protein [Prolixibacter denitrificans]|nr:hypothetical protein [Prolixibacter denitrificans]PSK82304.1 hypothetical protein CLV93_10648 [Prolixibacter denitrificans]
MNKLLFPLLVVFFIGVIFVVQMNSRKSNEERESLALHGGFAIGVFEGRVASNTTTSSISFSYIIDSHEYRGGDTRCMQDSRKAALAFTDPDLAKSGDRFLVLYNMETPKKAIIRLDYPIKDSTSFKQYVREFEEMRKKKATGD